MFSRELEVVSPGSVGIDGERLEHALTVLRSGIGTAFPGATVCVYHNGKCFLDVAIGTLDGTTPTTPESLYDLASITKPMATATSVLTLVERGELTLTQTLGDFFGEAAGDWQLVKVRELLTHTSGLPFWVALYKSGLGLDSAVSTILALSSADRPKPREKYEYSCLNYILLGKIIQNVSGTPLDTFVRENIFTPLGLLDTAYKPDAILIGRIAPTQSEEGPEETHPSTLRGTAHDGNARGIGGVSGNSGLFGTARDVARFGNALLHPDSEVRLFGKPTMVRIWENQISDIGGQSLLFFAQGNAINPAGDLLSSRTVGHSGYTGTALTIDPAYDLAIAVLTNSVFPTTPGAKSNWLALRRRFLNALAAAIV